MVEDPWTRYDRLYRKLIGHFIAGRIIEEEFDLEVALLWSATLIALDIVEPA